MDDRSAKGIAVTELEAALRAVLDGPSLNPRPRLANGPVSVRFDGSVLRVIDASGLLLELHDCRQIAVQMPQFPLELMELEEGRKS